MRVSRSDAPEGPFDADHFSGAVSRIDHGAIESPEGTALLVRFPPGARTHWHSHPTGQVLYVTEGHGRVGTRDGRVEEVRAGDLVVAAADEEHWHGAATDAEVRHLALSFGATEWLEPVEPAEASG
jgi:quercetin dioxygenase-like cupin family protein